MSEYKGANNTKTLQGNTKEVCSKKIVNATRFSKLKKLLGKKD